MHSIDLIEKFRLSHNLQIPDAIIGATAIVNQVPFFTYKTLVIKLPHCAIIDLPNSKCIS